jgi:hypothetical protein
LIFQGIGILEYIPCYGGPAEHWGLLPATRLASSEILIEENIKKRTGPALCVLCGCNNKSDLTAGVTSMSVDTGPTLPGTGFWSHSSKEDVSLFLIFFTVLDSTVGQ